MTSPPPCRELGAFVRHLEARGRLRRVKADVDKDTELACIARWALECTTDAERYAILFERVRGQEMPVLVHAYATLEMYAEALGTPPDGILERWAAAMAGPKPTTAADDGPVHEIVETQSADLTRLPIPVWTPGRDAGPYLSAACVITKDPLTGVQNLGTYRIQIHDSRTVGVFFGSALQHGAMHHERYSKMGEPTPVALIVGAPPVVNFAAAAKTAYGIDELTIAGGLLGEGLEVVRGRTVDLMVPARAECVIEGFIDPGAKRQEGPFGEALGYMNDAAPAPFMRVTAITRRRSAIHHGYVQQLPPSDGHLLMELGVLGPLYFYLTRKLGTKGIRDLAIARGSAGIAMLLVQLERAHAGGADALGRALTKLNFGQKFVYLVDEDVDIRDPETVNWAISSRVDPKRDITVVSNVKTFQLDPSIFAANGGVMPAAPPYDSSMVVVNATLKCRVPEISLPARSYMEHVLTRWGEWGLPPVAPRERVTRLLETHSDDALYF